VDVPRNVHLVGMVGDADPNTVRRRRIALLAADRNLTSARPDVAVGADEIWQSARARGPLPSGQEEALGICRRSYYISPPRAPDASNFGLTP